MPEPLFAAFSASYAFLQKACCEVAAHFPSVLEAVCKAQTEGIFTDEINTPSMNSKNR
jgi:hypothetical protein